MHRKILVFHFIVAYAFCPSISFGQMILVKCSDADGAITYMTDQCGEGMTELDMLPEKAPANNEAQASRSTHTPTHWAEPIVHRRTRPDVELVRSAKMHAELMDAERHRRIFQQAAAD